MLPFTIEIKGRTEGPIDAKKVAFGTHGEDIFAYIVTADDRIASCNKDEILVFWQNLPTKEDMEHIDRLISEGKDDKNRSKPLYNGVEIG